MGPATATSNLGVIEGFLGLWRTPGGMVDALDKYLADDVVWRNTGFPECVGKSACVELARQLAVVYPAYEIEIIGAAAGNDKVFVQRVERCLLPSGTASLVLDVCGVFTLRAERIVLWQDYFDPAALRRALAVAHQNAMRNQ